MKRTLIVAAISTALFQPTSLLAQGVADIVINQQNSNLTQNTQGKGFGPQAPRDLGSKSGTNTRTFETAPHYSQMNLCDIHFHKNAEHKGGEFTTYAGNGDGKGYLSGYKYNGTLTQAEAKPLAKEVCPSKTGGLQSGDTIEIHYVHSSAQVEPGPTLATCLSETVMNPQLRVEGQVFVLVNDDKALDFMELTKVEKKDGYFQAVNLPNNTGTPYEYAGSTTGPTYNEKGSPLQVSWSVRPKVAKVNIKTLGQWCESNEFNEDHAHGVRNLVVDPELLSQMK